jgi:hypothetical protein
MPTFALIFPRPLACFCRGNKYVFFPCVNNARVLSDARQFQKRTATFVGGDCLEIIESTVHEINRSAFHRQRLGPFVGKNDGDGIRQHRRRGTTTGFFKAYDARTGKEPWEFNAGLGIISAPMCYSIDGRKYASVPVG